RGAVVGRARTWRPRRAPGGVPGPRRGAMRDLHARDADGGARLSRCRRQPRRRVHPRGDRRQPLPLYRLHEDRRRDRRRRDPAGRLMPAEPAIDVPRHLVEAYERLAAGPTRPIAGGTDVMVAITGELGPAPERMLDLSRVDALRGIHLEPDGLVLGARTTYTEIRRSALCREHLPALVEAAATIGAAQIQNRGTLGGNIANASPAGDTLPVLLALDAVIVVGGPRGERTIPAAEFWVAYRRTALAPDELILRVRIPVAGGREARFRKIGTRRAQAIS